MNIRQINEEYSVSGQITVEDVDTVKELGFKSIKIKHVPVGPMGVTPEAVVGMVDALEDFERPMLGYCRSGARSTATYEHALRQRG